MDVPLPPIVEERVQNCTLEHTSRSPVPPIMVASKAYTGKVFSVEMPHQHVHQAYIKGLDTFNLLRSGDVILPALHMEIPVPQIAEEIVAGTPWNPLFLLGYFGGSGKELSRWRLRSRKRRKRSRRRGGSWLRADLQRLRGRDQVRGSKGLASPDPFLGAVVCQHHSFWRMWR